jgi:two-component SAPR family response regulator
LIAEIIIFSNAMKQRLAEVVFRESVLKVILIIWLGLLAFATAFPQEYGLSFYNHDVLKDQRTGIFLTPEKEFTFKEDFELSFDLSLQQFGKFIYGYVFRIVLNGEMNIDLVYGNRSEGNRDFSIVEGKNVSEIAFNVDPALLWGDWINFRIKFLLEEDRIMFFEQDNVHVDSTIDLDTKSRVCMSFGACPRENFISNDVPPIMIRDIQLFEKGKLRNHWPLDEAGGEKACDIVSGHTASVSNPDWLRNAHLHWRRIRELKFSGNTQLAQNAGEAKIYWLGEDFLIKFDAARNLFDTVFYSDKPDFIIRDGQAVFDPLNEVIISYSLDSRQLFTIDPVSGRISRNQLEPYVRKEYTHHNKYYYRADSSLYIFNGYGHYLYKNKVLRCKVGSGIWEELSVKGKQPSPRYLSAAGYLDDTLYFLGGYGSESGRQMLSPEHYYDLHAFSLEELKYIKKESFPKPAEDYCFANSMVIDPRTRNYYALAFPEFKYNSQLQLVRGSLDKGSLERVGDQIPYPFNDINSFADLYYFPGTKKLYAVTLLMEGQEGTEAILYSIGFPPFGRETATGSGEKGRNRFWIILIIFPLAISVWLLRRFRGSGKKEDRIQYVTEMPEKKNAIYFFGGFQVFDRTGADITSEFTPLLKELFLIIMLHSIKNEKGISSERIIENLWFDKSERSARNNLWVNITKLKNILVKMDGCEVTHETGYWKIHQETDIYNDYIEAQAIVKLKDSVDSQAVVRLINITSKGPFLFNLGFEWLDEFKARISERITDTLLSFAESLEVNKDPQLIIDLADSLFNFDVVNEEIMVLKCRALCGQGKHSLAKNAYQNFCNEYRILYGEEYGQDFTDIINCRN